MISEFGMFFTLIRLIFMALVVPDGFEIRRLGVFSDEVNYDTKRRKMTATLRQTTARVPPLSKD